MIKLDTTGRGGTTVKKDVAVFTNDPANPNQTLYLTGQIDKLYGLTPKRLRLVGPVGTQIKQKLTLETKEKYPFKLLSVRAQNGTHIRYEFEEIKGQGTPTYEVTVENTREEEGRYLDKLFLVTDSKIQPEIEVPVYGFIQLSPEKKQK